MSLLLIAPERNLEPFKKALFRQDPDLDIDIWPDVTDRKRVTFAVTWNHPENLLDKFPNLKAVSSFGAGVEHLTEDKSLRDDITITRLVAPALKTQVADYVEMSCYNVMRRSADYFRQEQKKVWKVLSHSMKKDLAIGILGLGEIGANAAERMAGNQWHVSGWSRGPKQVSGVRTFSGPEGKTPFLKETNIAVSLLPLTPETEGILNLDLFKKLKKPAYLINAGRGGHLVEEDLIYALDAGILEGAVLDVFDKEPLPDNHPFWNRPAVTITPHIASKTDPEDLARLLIENYKRMLSGLELQFTVDRTRGY